MTNIQELAEKTGVSVATVSRALNGSPEVSKATRERILALARELDYTPSAAARTLVSSRSHVIGVILETGAGHPDLMHPFFQQVLVGLKHGAGERGYDLLLFSSDEPGNGFGGTHSYVRRAGHHGVDGVVVMGYDPSDPEMRRLVASGLPCITIDADPGEPHCGYVMSENRDGAAQAVRHLHGLGHTRIATIAGPPWTRPGPRPARGLPGGDGAPRRRGARRVRDRGDFYDESGYRTTRQLLELAEPPTAVFAASDLMAAGALRAANELGVRVPEDLAVVGFDDITVAALIQPALTTIRQDMHSIGEAAAEGLGRMIDDPDAAPVQQLAPVHLVVRSSCGAQGAPRERTLAGDKEVR